MAPDIVKDILLTYVTALEHECQNQERLYGIGTLHYNWPMSAHASHAVSIYTSACDCTDSEHLPKITHALQCVTTATQVKLLTLAYCS